MSGDTDIAGEEDALADRTAETQEIKKSLRLLTVLSILKIEDGFGRPYVQRPVRGHEVKLTGSIPTGGGYG